MAPRQLGCRVPCAKGPNWSSALELGIRLINWAVAWQLLGGPHAPLFEGTAGLDLRRRWLESIHQHARFIENHFSRYSSANNHLIEEAAGLFVAGITWPYWPEARCWMERARTILEREALLQNAADGVNLEQAASYQHFVLDLLLLPLLAGRANGVDFPSAYYARIESMLEYLASIMDVGGNVPMIGDVDDALVVKLDHRSDFCPYRSLLATGALLFNRPDFKAKAGRLDDKTRWLLGKEADGAYARIDAGALRLPVKRSFPLGGYYILGCGSLRRRAIAPQDFQGPPGVGTVEDLDL